ncbi:MAG: type II/IV secretion system ATPase subunit [Nitrososphaerota archaeon]
MGLKLSLGSRKAGQEKKMVCPSCGRETRVLPECEFCGYRLGREEIAADALVKRIQELMALKIRPPVPLEDDGRGETLAEYSVGAARVRIALERGSEAGEEGSWGFGERREYVGLYVVQEPQLTARVKLAYLMTIYHLYITASVPPPTAIRRGRAVEAKREGEVGQEQDPLSVEVRKAADGIASQLRLSEPERTALHYYVNRDTVRFGIISVPMEDELVEDISCVAPGKPVRLIHRDFADLHYLRTNIVFQSDQEITDYIVRQANRAGAALSVAKPYADFVMPDGSRFAGVIGTEVTAEGPSFTIRKFPEVPLSLPALVARRMLSPYMAAYLWLALESKAIFGVAGPTGSGKTTLFSALLSCLNPRAKIITIEDTFEIRIPHEHWLRMTTRRPAALVSRELEISESELIDMAMRMRPHYLIVGEVRRDDSVYHLLKAAFSGHGGGFTFHAGSADEFYSRLGIMLRRSGMSETLVSYLWGCAITDHVTLPNGRYGRRVIEIAEILPDPSQAGVTIQKVFEWDQFTDAFVPDTAEEAVERSPKLKATLGREKAVRELERRANLLVENPGDDIFTFAKKVAAEVYAV